MPSRSRQPLGRYPISLAWASNYYVARAGKRSSSTCARIGRGSPDRWPTSIRRLALSEMKALASHSRFVGRVFETSSHLTQYFRGSLDVARIDVIKEVTANTGEVHRPRQLQFGHAPGSDLRDVATRVRCTRRLRHESTRLKVVDQARHSARRKVGGARQVGHPQLSIWGFGEVHDRGVLARRHADTPYEVAVEESRENLENTHLGAPESLFAGRKRFDRGHLYDFNLLRQATLCTGTGNTDRRFNNLIKSKKGRCGK